MGWAGIGAFCFVKREGDGEHSTIADITRIGHMGVGEAIRLPTQPRINSMLLVRLTACSTLATAGGICWLTVPLSSSWIGGLILFSSAMFLIFVALIAAVATLESECSPMTIAHDPFASPMHKAARRSYRRGSLPTGLASPSWYRDAFGPRALTASERSAIAE